MKKQLKRFYSRITKSRRIHPDDVWHEIELSNRYKAKKRKKYRFV